MGVSLNHDVDEIGSLAQCHVVGWRGGPEKLVGKEHLGCANSNYPLQYTKHQAHRLGMLKVSFMLPIEDGTNEAASRLDETVRPSD